jgi:alanyl-tRNA synthetase
MHIALLRQKFLEYYAAAGYKVVPAASLLPQNDPSVLFTTAGMQQFKPYYADPTAAPSDRVASVQPVIRTSDIAEVGDDTHLTSFEMLGNFRFGQKSSLALKKEAIAEAWRFITEVLQVERDRIFVTVFGGDATTPADTESEGVWHSLGVTDVRHEGRSDNFWGPTGDEGPCGPTTEIYVDGVEVWNLVFNEYFSDRDGVFTKLEKTGLDTGSGLERLACVLAGQGSVWEIEPFQNWVEHTDPHKVRESRIITDHLRAAIFLIGAGVLPGNKGRDYILRRLVRKTVFLASQLTTNFDWDVAVFHIHAFYASAYELPNKEDILEVLLVEKQLFEKNLNRARLYLEKWLNNHTEVDEKAITELAFYMYESFGFPKELVVEYLAGIGWKINNDHFNTLFARHQEISRSGLERQFKGGLSDHEPQTVKHHTAHHLLLAALQQVLGKEVVQKGSNVTGERLRIDFNFDRKLTEEELGKVESIVNEKIAENLPVTKEEMSRDEALESGAQAEFGAKYGEKVTVYSIGDFSKELCGGPHVERTGALGKFKILKEEASSQGVRRIKAKLN